MTGGHISRSFVLADGRRGMANLRTGEVVIFESGDRLARFIVPS